MSAKNNAHGTLANDSANVHRTRRYRRDWQWQRYPARIHIIQRADVIPEHKRAVAKLPCFVVTSALKLAADTHDVATKDQPFNPENNLSNVFFDYLNHHWAFPSLSVITDFRFGADADDIAIRPAFNQRCIN